MACSKETASDFLVEIGRALGGAAIFSIPIFMTMEMWELGATMDRYRLALLVGMLLPLLMGISRYIGLEKTRSWSQDIADSFLAIAVGFVCSGVILLLLGAIGLGMGIDEIAGQIGLQTVPASIGAMLARSQFGQKDEDDGEQEERQTSYGSEVFLMAAGALFLSFSVAPTEEVELIASQTTVWHLVVLMLLLLVAMHAFVYSVRFRGQEVGRVEGVGFLSIFLRYTLVGYAVAFAMSLYVLWTFGQIDGEGLQAVVATTVVLSLPAALGAAAARLIL
ncbi:putative integral membrane protein (TIGR02587 family) [Amorphus suaedae]